MKFAYRAFDRAGQARADVIDAGSVAEASPVNAKAWQRQPPKSIARRSQLLHGSGIHASPRYAISAFEELQMSASDRSLTLSNVSDVMLVAA